MPEPIPLEAVVFDLDGTLVATDQFWIPAARAATRRVFAERDIALAQPSGNEWMRLVGFPMDVGLKLVLPDLDQASMAVLHAACIEEENALLSAGRASLLPGAAEMLATLHARGLKLGIASNCGRHYLEHMLEALDLKRWVTEARCLDSPGIRDKTEMVADILLHFGLAPGGPAMMVGDRRGDIAAGADNGLVTVGYTGAFGDSADHMGADHIIEHLGELPALVLGAGARG
ncbi:MAG: HAD family hydrolase [Planctomycetota bacterium]|nr:HAD family hydrolase [Planctomycetota bacterium]